MVNRIASILGMLLALMFSVGMALGAGIAAYALTSPEIGFQKAFAAQRGSGVTTIPSAEFIFFSIFALSYLLWSTIPLSIGTSRNFDPGNMLLYPVSLRKLFALDFISEVVSFQAVFAIPVMLAIGVGAGLGSGRLIPAILISLAAILFGLSLSKWISVSVGSLLRRKRTRGETLLAMIGVVAGLGGALFGQIAPVVFRHAESIFWLRWTPPGAIAYALTSGLSGARWLVFGVALLGVLVYAAALIALTYRLSSRSFVGTAGRRRARPQTPPDERVTYTGWNFPLMSLPLSAIVEKEFRYMMRNAQIKMMTLTPLILIVVRFMNRRSFGQFRPGNMPASGFYRYGEGLMVAGGLLYVFIVLAGLFCNQFGFESAGMRTLVLSPVSRKSVLLGKNIAISVVAVIFALGFLTVNELVFRDLTPNALLFAVLSFLTLLWLMLVMGNSFSLRSPKRLKFGKRLNISGVAGLLLIPMIVVLALPPLAAAAAGYIAESLLVEYVTLGVLMVLSFGFYLLMIGFQGEALQHRELQILEAVNEPGTTAIEAF